MAALKYRKHQVLDGFTAFILCTKMSLCKIEDLKSVREKSFDLSLLSSKEQECRVSHQSFSSVKSI